MGQIISNFPGGGENVTPEVEAQVPLVDELESFIQSMVGLPEDADATAADILYPKKAYVGQQLITGTLAQEGFGDAAVSDVVIGKTFTSDSGIKEVGTLDPESLKSGSYVWKKFTAEIFKDGSFNISNISEIDTTNHKGLIATLSSNEYNINDYEDLNGFETTYMSGSVTKVGLKFYKTTVKWWVVLNPSDTRTYSYSLENGTLTIQGIGCDANMDVWDKPITCTGGAEITEFIGYVISDDPNKYPDGGEKNGYWYEKVNDEILNMELKGWYTISSSKGMKMEIPYPFYQSSAVVLNDEIHVLGSSESGYGSRHYKWNGTAWTMVSTLPYILYRGSAVVLNDEIHFLGGQNKNTVHYKWNGIAWTEVSTLPYPFYQGPAVVLNDEIHILGGKGVYTAHYKWNGTAWTSVSTLPYDFYDGCAVVLNDEIHILGGSVYTPHYKWNGTAWTRVSTLPYNFADGSAVINGMALHGRW